MDDASDIPAQKRPLHLLNRLAFGPRPGDIEHLRQVGPEGYIHEQLYPESEIPIPASLHDQIANYRTLHMSPLELFREFQGPIMEVRRQDKGADKDVLKGDLKDARIRQQIVMREAIEARIARAIDGPRQLQEVLTAFWFNHFNVFRGKGLDNIWTGSFEETAIRPHTMGKFRTMLLATAKHPAMLFYLDNWQNTNPGSAGAKGKFEGINENYAREVMELHTLGVGGGYSQADVIALAHILTGWGISRENPNREKILWRATGCAARCRASAVASAGRARTGCRRRRQACSISIPIGMISRRRLFSATRSRAPECPRARMRSRCWRGIRRPRSI